MTVDGKDQKTTLRKKLKVSKKTETEWNGKQNLKNLFSKLESVSFRHSFNKSFFAFIAKKTFTFNFLFTSINVQTKKNFIVPGLSIEIHESINQP